jgi:hypothetical protein
MLDKEDIHRRTYLYLSYREMKKEESVGCRRCRVAYAQVGRRIDYSHDASPSTPLRASSRLAKPKSQVTRIPHAACS